MTKEKSVHITLRMPLRRRVEFSVACDMLDVTMSKKLHRVIAETIALAEAKNPSFHQLVEDAMQKESDKAVPKPEPDEFENLLEIDGSEAPRPSPIPEPNAVLL